MGRVHFAVLEVHLQSIQRIRQKMLLAHRNPIPIHHLAQFAVKLPRNGHHQHIASVPDGLIQAEGEAGTIPAGAVAFHLRHPDAAGILLRCNQANRQRQRVRLPAEQIPPGYLSFNRTISESFSIS